MPKMKSFVLRNIPERLHRDMKSESALEGVSINQFILHIIDRVIEERRERRKQNAGNN